MRLIKRGKTTLENLKKGCLFLSGTTLCLKSEYTYSSSTTPSNGAIEAYIVGSGEMFWGGTNNAYDQRKLIVTEVEFIYEEDVKTSVEWEKIANEEYGLVIMDPDGWDRTNFNYSFREELITEAEFKKRVSSSTIKGSLNFFNS